MYFPSGRSSFASNAICGAVAIWCRNVNLIIAAWCTLSGSSTITTTLLPLIRRGLPANSIPKQIEQVVTFPFRPRHLCGADCCAECAIALGENFESASSSKIPPTL